ncbi:MAG: carboxymuconolactone decarboxylase family protein [Streptosporangiaceae bacterium]|jgi:AhpD family alkylhydroperoxidase
MGGGFLRIALRSSSLAQVKHVPQIRFNKAGGLVASVYGQMEREFGMLAPPVTLHSPLPEVLAGCWLVLRETLIAPGRVTRSEKEAVAAAVSVSNSCPYCVTIHSGVMRALLPGPDAAALAADQVKKISDPQIAAIAAWGRNIADPEALTEAPFPAEHVPELLGVAVTFHYLNRMVNIFLGEIPLPPAAPEAVLGPIMRVAGRLMRSAGRNAAAPGASLSLLPDAPLPKDMSWAAGSPSIAGAYARLAASIEDAGHDYVPAAVRELLFAELAVWNGRSKGLSRAWVEDATRTLSDADRPAGRLALLTAFASYQVDQGVIDAFRATQPADETLVGLTSWASLTTARHIGAKTRLVSSA